MKRIGRLLAMAFLVLVGVSALGLAGCDHRDHHRRFAYDSPRYYGPPVVVHREGPPRGFVGRDFDRHDRHDRDDHHGRRHD